VSDLSVNPLQYCAQLREEKNVEQIM
jgi:hypothetical protein